MFKRFLLLMISVGMLPFVCSAELKDIDQSKLSSTSLEVYKAVLPLEPIVKHWSPKWPYKKPDKKSVAGTLKESIAKLTTAKGREATNEDSLLLLGLVAQFGHNVDVEGAAELAMDAYQRAQSLAPEDPRPGWFLGEHKCEAGLVTEGMNALLSVEKRASTSALPSTFWDDYLTCSTISNMPAHALRAVQIIRNQDKSLTERQSQLEKANANRFPELMVDKEYPEKEIWSVSDKNTAIEFTADVCGLRFSIPGSWGTKLFPTKGSQCTVVMQTGPYDTPGGKMYPNIALIARPARTGESLEDFSKQLRADNPSKAAQIPYCPVANCIAYESVKQGAYKDAGDGLAIYVAFGSREPEVRGLKFEQPQGPPQGEAGKVRYYRPNTRYLRTTGTYYYQVLLDTATTMNQQAMNDLLTVLKSIEVE